ncbi:hypothetical protein ATANTOWER_011738 [Ataeniobius toweri]|uniref:Chemokine interleukin-8-like domain-containing protein n=1 Tax=Ataeniobius toweri TaxID=208326 RepID=A0ABU7A5R6_9TELE|nr:hypothetical protein [Ataeniobius toweri]
MMSFILFLLVTLVLPTFSAQGISKCCLKYPSTKVHRSLLKSYSLQDSSLCDVPAVVYINIHPSIHPSIVFRLSGVGTRGQQPKQRDPDFAPPSHLGQLVQGNPKAFPGQPRNIIPPACPRSSSGSPPGGTCPEHLTR